MKLSYKATHTPSKRVRVAIGLPKGVGWCVALPRDLLHSPAWLAMSTQCRMLVDALMAELADHGGVENGNLKAPYDMLQARGMRRGTILNAVVEANALGLVHCSRGQRSYGSRKAPSIYRLTWLGTPDGLTATNEWKGVKSENEARARIEKALAELMRERAIKAATRAENAQRHSDQRRSA